LTNLELAGSRGEDGGPRRWCTISPMRKVLSMLMALAMTLILGVTPSFAVIPADAFSGWYGFSGTVKESRLPACCRRHGAHHCAMGNMGSGESTTSSAGSSDAGFATANAPSTCPFGPKALASAVLTFAAMLLLVLIAPGPQPQAFRIGGRTEARNEARPRGWPKRGPPVAQLL
jgi:hypothetical protein